MANQFTLPGVGRLPGPAGWLCKCPWLDRGRADAGFSIRLIAAYVQQTVGSFGALDDTMDLFNKRAGHSTRGAYTSG